MVRATGAPFDVCRRLARKGNERMGTLLFVFAAVIEVFLVVFCLRTKSNQTKAKGYVRIGALTGFALLLFFKVIDWGIRYYALSALLLLLTVFGLLGITRKNAGTASFKPGRAVLRAVGMTILFLLVTLPAIAFPRHSPLEVTGRYGVSTANFTYMDASRSETYASAGEYRKLMVGYWYPAKADGKYPLVVFSHGGISGMNSNESLYRELASHGYVVASISHPYHAIAATDEDGHTIWIDRGYLREILGEDAKTNRYQSYQYYQKWMKIRMDDINFVIDYILSEAGNDEANSVYRLVDRAAIGVMGHSFGGSAALGIGRIRDDVGAVIALESPFMYDIKGVENGEFVLTDGAYPVPVLNVYSDSTWSRLGELPQYAQNHALLIDHDATVFNVHMSGVGHFSLTDLALSSPVLTRMLNRFRSTVSSEDSLRMVNKVCLEFLDSYLKKMGEFTPSGAK